MSADGRRGLSDEDRTLWDRVARSVAPLRRKPKRSGPAEAGSPANKASGKATPSVRGPTAARSAAAAEKFAARSAPSLEPLDRTLKRRLARGTVAIDARIDLHGKTQSEAHAALLRFLRKAQADGAKFALVITGKGARDAWSERGVLKRQVPLWLKLPEFRACVVGFEDAHIGHGGQGALYVRIRNQRSGIRAIADA
jgi:DNA-nicking Smr family endonuclease